MLWRHSKTRANRLSPAAYREKNLRVVSSREFRQLCLSGTHRYNKYVKAMYGYAEKRRRERGWAEGEWFSDSLSVSVWVTGT